MLNSGSDSLALFLIVQVERESQKLEDWVVSTPFSLARGSSAFSKFTQLVHGTAKFRKLALLQTRAERIGGAEESPSLDAAFSENSSSELPVMIRSRLSVVIHIMSPGHPMRHVLLL